jgi:hypothetical protein
MDATIALALFLAKFPAAILLSKEIRLPTG